MEAKQEVIKIGENTKLQEIIYRVKDHYFNDNIPSKSNKESKIIVDSIVTGNIDIRRICLSGNQTSHNVVAEK